MPWIVTYDPLGNVPNKVIQYKTSVDITKITVPDNTLIDPNLTSVTNVDLLYWKAKPSNNSVIEMTQIQKNKINDDIAAEQAAQQEALKNIDNLQEAVKTLAKLSFKEINKLRVKDGDSEYTWEQFKNAYKTEYGS